MMRENGIVSYQRMRLLALVSVVLTGLLVACSGGASELENDPPAALGFSKNADGFADISVEALVTLLESEEVTLINVHIPYEGELPETDLFIPYDEIADYVDQLPDKDAPVVLYCRSGGMSTEAAQELAALGYTSVLEVDGGFKAWKAAGYELVGE
jgi:rhodanese-related sulfurtransferase